MSRGLHNQKYELLWHYARHEMRVIKWHACACVSP